MWLDKEFHGVEFGDKRLIKRFKHIMQEFMKKAQSILHQLLNLGHQLKVAIVFLVMTKLMRKLY